MPPELRRLCFFTMHRWTRALQIGMVNTLATRLPDLGAAVPFYGTQPTAEDAARIKAPLLLHYASLDTRITDRNGQYASHEASRSRCCCAVLRYTTHR